MKEKNNLEKKYYSQKIEDVLISFSTKKEGLSKKEAKKRLLENGPNELPEAKRESIFSIFLHQFKSPLIYILLLAGVVVFLMDEMIDAVVIFFVLFFNALIGTIQEGKAQNTFLALRKFIKGSASVLRDGKEFTVPDRELVVGDIITLREGEKVPADARIIEASSFKVNESALTGESIPKFKNPETIRKKNVYEADQTNMVFNGTIVVSGKAKAIVVATGMETFLGSVAKEALGIDSEFPLKNEVKKLSKIIILAVIITSIILFFVGIFSNFTLEETVITIIAVAVSLIPEGLPIVVTLVLASGVWRMGKKNVLVKKLQAVEVLGETKVIAVDKTGTITKNELILEKVYINEKIFEINGSGYNPKGDIFFQEDKINPLENEEARLAGKIASLNSGANLIFDSKKRIWKIAGDPTEGAMLVFSKKAGFERKKILQEFPIIDEIPFDYELKFHASLHKAKENNLILLTGSPEAILSLSSKEWSTSGNKKISTQRKKELEEFLKKMSSQGLRVIGFAYSDTKEDKINKEKLPQLVFGGFFGIKDPLREEVKKSVFKVNASGIKVVMITGDHKITAKSIAKEAGIYKEGDLVLGGDEIEKLKDRELAGKIKNVSVFARVTPKHKLKIIKAYQSNGMIIAMTGDGVNDALSLSAADIGISMGKIGTEVAKEASDLILLDDNFGNIAHGVEEGRNIFITIKKVVLYLLSTSLGELITILVAVFLGFPLPILAVHILWLNLVTDGFLDVALAMEPNEKLDKMSKKNYPKKSSLFDKAMFYRMFFMASVMAIGTLYLFGQNYQENIEKAWTISLTVLAVFQWFNAWNCRSDKKSIFSMNPFSNKFLVGATLIVIFLQLMVIYNSFLQKIMRTVPLDYYDWLVILIVASSIIFAEEGRKFIVRNFSKSKFILKKKENNKK